MELSASVAFIHKESTTMYGHTILKFMMVGLINVKATREAWQTRKCRSPSIANDCLQLEKKTKTALGMNYFQAELSA
jgi:hypothetical protein